MTGLSRRVFAYCAVTFAISWGGIFILIGPLGVPLDEAHLVQLLGFGYVGMLLGPSIAAVALTALFDGRAGLRALGTSLTRWRVGGRWWAIAILTAPASILLSLLVLTLISPDYIPRLIVEADRASLLGYVAVSATLTGVFEELGWTGFVARSLLQRRGVLATALIVGLLTAPWNFLIVYVKELAVTTPGALPMPLYLAVGLLTWQVAFRVLIVWVYERTRSVLVAMLMQTSLVAAWTSLTPLALDRTGVAVFYVVLTALWSLVAIAALRPTASGSAARGRVSGATRPGTAS